MPASALQRFTKTKLHHQCSICSCIKCNKSNLNGNLSLQYQGGGNLDSAEGRASNCNRYGIYIVNCSNSISVSYFTSPKTAFISYLKMRTIMQRLTRVGNDWTFVRSKYLVHETTRRKRGISFECDGKRGKL